jgi:hypothetical protein
MQSIVVRYRPNVLQSLLVLILVFGVCAAALIAIHRLIFDSEPTDAVRMIYLVVALVFGTTLSALLILKDREKMQWLLSESELVGGMKHPVRIPISNIVSISEGVPARTKSAENSPWRQSGIVLKTVDNKVLSLNLATSEEGVKLMRALLERCSSVLTSAPSYTETEMVILHRLKWNIVIDISSGKPV